MLLQEWNHRTNYIHRWAMTVMDNLHINLINQEQKVIQLGHTYWRNLSLQDSWHIILQNKILDKEILKPFKKKKSKLSGNHTSYNTTWL